MTDDDIHPLFENDLPDDVEVKARLVQLYRHTPSSDQQTVAQCVRAVLARAAEELRIPASAPRLPRQVAVPSRKRWVFGVTAIAAVLLLAVAVRSRVPGSVGSTLPVLASGPESGSGSVVVPGQTQFELRLRDLKAAKVFVVGDFNGWDASATPMTRGRGDGEWSAQVALLPGRHVYAYVVNGERWVVDPLAPQIPDAGYGPANAVVVEGDTK